MRRALVPVVWLFTGAATVAALYWALLNTPDSNPLMLIGSALLVLAIIAVSAIAVGGVVVATREGTWSPRVVSVALRAVPWFVVSLAPLMLVWWLTARADGWLESRIGEISAWFIARFGWADVSWLVTGATWALAWVRWVVGPWLSLTLFVAGLDPARPASLITTWLTRASQIRLLALATLWFVIFVALPWRLAFWRPGGLPPNWIEAMIAGLRLLTAGLLMTIGATLIIRQAGQRSASPIARCSDMRAETEAEG